MPARGRGCFVCAGKVQPRSGYNVLIHRTVKIESDEANRIHDRQLKISF
jgi:hypothetical protein